MTGWSDLRDELAAWQSLGRTATLWWRDDDAVAPTPALERLLELADKHGVPIALAVVPAQATEALATRLDGCNDHVCVLQHGFAHANHAPESEKSMELGAHRPAAAVCEELAEGWARLTALFGGRALPVLVPPWNRIASELLPGLAGLGLRGLSTHGPRAAPEAAGLAVCNSHVDVLRWRPTRGFLGEAATLDLLIGHLSARRQGQVDAAEPSGLLTHHLVMDVPAWEFLARLLAALDGLPSVRWVAAEEAFGLSTATAAVSA